jgi:hypothetical protein
MASHLIAKWRQSIPWLAAKPEKRAECHVDLVKFDPDDAAAWPIPQPHIDRNRPRFCFAVTCLELDVTKLIVAGHHDVIAAGVDFGAQQLDIPISATPQLSEQLPEEEMLENAGAQLEWRES